jgi:hypothetical protein
LLQPGKRHDFSDLVISKIAEEAAKQAGKKQAQKAIEKAFQEASGDSPEIVIM